MCKLCSFFFHTVVVEKTSPPVPVEVGPDVSTSSASQVIAPTQVTGMMHVFHAGIAGGTNGYMFQTN